MARKSQVGDRSELVPMTLSDPRLIFFWKLSVITLVLFDIERPSLQNNTWGGHISIGPLASHASSPPIPRGRGSSIPQFWNPLRTPIRCRATKFGVVTCVSGGLITPPITGWRPSVPPPKFWDLHGWRNSNQMLHGDQTRWEENFDIVDHATRPGWNFSTRMLMRDLFAVAYLLVWHVPVCSHRLRES